MKLMTRRIIPTIGGEEKDGGGGGGGDGRWCDPMS
jgi:hypothetical protein